LTFLAPRVPRTLGSVVFGNPITGDPGKVRDILHGSVNPGKLRSGEVFQLEVSYVDPFGFTHHSVPNACIIP
jgi:hypothetical protein